MSDQPKRKKLDHDVPHWVGMGSEDEAFFITLCTRPRHENQLACDDGWDALLETVLFREARGQLKCGCLLAMPDHLHAIMRFPGAPGMKRVLPDMKEWLAKSRKITWQRDFFDHRLRSEESAIEKRSYISLNPVRAGFVRHPEEWPYRYGW